MNLEGEFELNYANLHNYTRHIPFPIVTDISYSTDCVLSHLVLLSPQFEMWNVLRTQLVEVFQVE